MKLCARLAVRHLAVASAIAALALGCESSPPSEAHGAGAPVPTGRVLLPVAEGAWQVFYLTDAWVARHLGDDGVRRAWLRLAPAHAEDIEDDTGPCPAPQRIVLGAIQREDAIRERTIACLHVCGPAEPDGSLYRGLFATATQLEGLTVQILEDGSISVLEHYRELGFTPPEIAEDPNVVAKLRFGKGERILQRSVAPSDFEFPAGEAGSCIALEEGL